MCRRVQWQTDVAGAAREEGAKCQEDQRAQGMKLFYSVRPEVWRLRQRGKAAAAAGSGLGPSGGSQSRHRLVACEVSS